MAKFTVDFSGVEDKNFLEPGKYTAKVKSVSKEEGSEYPYLKWVLVVLGPTSKGTEISHITSLKPSALFNLRNFLISCGVNVPKKAVSFDPSNIFGKTLGIEVAMREYNGKDYANVKRTFSASDVKTSTAKVEVTTDDGDDTMVLTDDDF